ncbi:MAG: KpsF/GutQ family sugar-phosphate isomerase [Elusimicrobia bacterium]|nr:KpsF/GutQ family sugar-phosphate isomerase [Elusimicrobiota bacterium]
MKRHRTTRSRAIDIAREIRRVIGMEEAALRKLKAAVDSSYERAVRWMLGCKGKVVLTGVGKSGLVARKIAATLSSTGTPALYLPCSEAAHGSLGVVSRLDIVLAVGKSGESDELNLLLPSIRSIGARVIAVTSDPKSTLGRSADLVLLTPDEDEACPLNLAPTCSTTAALAAGDALAVALMKLRDFKSEHFARVHPAGRLGRRLRLKVGDVMRSGEDNPVVRAGDPVRHMLVEITRFRAGAVSVVDAKGRFLGLVTDYDLRAAMQKGADVLASSIRRIMNPRPATVSSSAPVQKAVDIMKNRRSPFNVLPVVDRGKSVGMIQIHDLRARGL